MWLFECMIKCLDKKRLFLRTPCLSCSKRFNQCKMKQELVDSGIFLNVFLEEGNKDECSSLLNQHKKSYIGYLTTIQVSHIVRRFTEKIMKLERDNPQDIVAINHLTIKFENCLNKVREFYIIDFDEKELPSLEDLRKENSLRIEFHDKLNVAVAINNRLNIQTSDRDLFGDSVEIKKIANDYGKKIEINLV